MLRLSAAALLALAYTAMETTFIFVAIFAIFLCAHFAFEFLRPRVNWNNGMLTLFAAVFGIPVFGLVAAIAIVALRLVIGWHFYREGADKLIKGDFQSAAFMRVATGPLRPYPWLAAKLLIFAFLIFCGFMIRIKIPPFVEGFKVLAAGGATPESDRLMKDGMGASLPYVFAIWAGVAISALIGILKPGQVPLP